MDKPRNPEEISLTLHAVEKKAAKLKQLYMKRLKKHEGRRPKKELFIIAAAYLLFKEKYPERKTGFTQLVDWLQNQYGATDENTMYDFDMKKFYKWRGRRPFKEMQWEGAWEDLRVAQKISDGGANKGQMSLRKIMRAHMISKQELENLIPIILSHHIGNKKISNEDSPA